VYEKILVPLDGSKRAEMIRPHVRELASRFQATVILITVIEYVYADGIGETHASISRKNFEKPHHPEQACCKDETENSADYQAVVKKR